MSEKEEFLAQIDHLLTWLYACQLPDVQAERDIPPNTYSENFVKWLAVRFRTKHGRKGSMQIGKTKEERILLMNTTPATWIVGLQAARISLHEVTSFGTSRLLLIEMSDSTAAHVPVQYHTHYDENGIFNIKFICEKYKSGRSGLQEIRLTNVGQAVPYGRIGSKCVWGGINFEGESVDPEEFKDEMCGYNDMLAPPYGYVATQNCGKFAEEMRSEYFVLYNETEQPLVIVHRVDGAVRNQTLTRQSYKEKDPVGFALKKAAYRASMKQSCEAFEQSRIPHDRGP